MYQLVKEKFGNKKLKITGRDIDFRESDLFTPSCFDFSNATEKESFKVRAVEVKFVDQDWIKVRYYAPKRNSSIDAGKWFFNAGWSPYFTIRSEYLLTDAKFFASNDFRALKNGKKLHGLLPYFFKDLKGFEVGEKLAVLPSLVNSLLVGRRPDSLPTPDDLDPYYFDDRRIYKCI